MKLGEFIGLESRSVEFKELRLSCGISFELYLSTEELAQLLDHGIWTPAMNQAIYQKIVRDSREYFPKYISAFLNTKELGFQGRLHYGVNDLGTLVGIPILGELNHSKIRRLFTKSLSKIHCFDSKTHQQISHLSLQQWVSLQIKPITTVDPSYLQECEAHCRQASFLYKKGYRREMYQRLSYQKRYQRYQKQLGRFTGKLKDMIQTRYHRDGIIEFIQQTTQTSMYRSIIELLQSDTYIIVPRGDIFIQSKTDPSNVIYWLVKYKDFHSLRVQKEKPPRILYKNPYCLSNIINNLSYMSSRFYKNNPSLTWWNITITVTIPKEKSCLSQYDFYYLDSRNQLNYKIRNQSHQIPGLST